ncbi:hypothetical protein AV530_017681 [Patagioenas fasciata monilis]|uniref:Uncharacterized protein n=1 Tax=Patagioenas fasciata monilis TaxID=372326 RepID=A0A1V4KRH5_PATFA|nr:hypothetical protein AV530_017681 [Patagioenas fasciata monilis]
MRIWPTASGSEPVRDIRCEFCGEYFENRKDPPGTFGTARRRRHSHPRPRQEEETQTRSAADGNQAGDAGGRTPRGAAPLGPRLGPPGRHVAPQPL